MKNRKKLSIGNIIIYAVVAVALIVYFFFYYRGEYRVNNPDSGELAMYAIDVGQGDSTFFMFPDGTNMLIDAGEAESADTVISLLDSLNIEKLDRVVCTHPHSDHIGGMAEVIDKYDVGQLYMSDAVNSTKSFYDMLDKIVGKSIDVNFVYAGDVIADDIYRITVLSPEAKDYSEINLFSVVIKVTYMDTSFIVTGDTENENEADMAEHFGTALECNVLRVGHHGSDTSTSDRFLSFANPEIAVISVGENNSYGHPSEKVINKLERREIKILRTDIDGTISLFSDGRSIKVKTGKDNL